MHLSASEIKKLLRKWHFYKACSSNPEEDGKLKRKLDAIEKAVYRLDDVSRKAIIAHYFNRATIEDTALLVFMTVRGTYYRIAAAVKEMVYLIENNT